MEPTSIECFWCLKIFISTARACPNCGASTHLSALSQAIQIELEDE